MKNVILRLRENSRYMNNSDRKIAEYILLNTEKVTHMNIRELSQETFSSASTIYRMCRSLGFQGYKDFKQSLIYDVALKSREHKPEREEIWRTDSLDKIVKMVTHQNILSLNDTESLVDFQSLKRCVSLLTEARTVLLFGVGESFCVARDAYLKFSRVNKPCIANEDGHAQLLTARNSGPEDLGIVISCSGETLEMQECMKEMRNNRTPMIAITRLSTSPVARLSDYTLYTAATESLLGHDEMPSRISQLNVIDILYTAYTFRQHDALAAKRSERK